MTNIIIFSPATEHLEQLLAYSRTFSLHFYIARDKAEVLKYFTAVKPLLFLVSCFDEEQAQLKFLRQLSPDTPIIALGDVLPPHKDAAIVIKAFQHGAIDFIRLPCDSEEFYYRLRANICLLNRLQQQNNASAIHLGNIKIFLQHRQVMLDNDFISLTKSEYDILLLLASNLNKTVTTQELYEKLWSSSDLMNTSRAIAMHISRLRHKLRLERNSRLELATVYKNGYCLKMHTEQKQQEKRKL